MKIVLDTNLLVASMFNKQSASAELLEKAAKGEIAIMWHPRIRDEARLITRKIEKSVPGKKIDLNKIFKEENRLEQMPDVKGVSKDPDDDKFLACGLGAKADIIVSNDSDLLEVKIFEGIEILSPSDTLRRIEKSA